MNKTFKCGLAVLGLALAVTTSIPAVAAERAGIQIGGGGIGITVGNGHYYDKHHRRQAYSYPSDWKTYHHPRSWYRSHREWNNQNGHDWYRH